MALDPIQLDFVARLEGLLQGIDSIGSKLTALTAPDYTVKLTVDPNTSDKLDRITRSLEGLLRIFDVVQSFGRQALGGFSSDLGAFGQVLGTTSKRLSADFSRVELGAGAAFKSVSGGLERATNPVTLGRLFGLTSAFALLIQNGFNLKTLLAGVVGSSAGFVRRLAEVDRAITSTSGAIGVIKIVGSGFLSAVPKLFAAASAIGLVLTAIRGITKSVERFVQRSPNSTLAQFSQLLRLTTAGLFRLDFKLQRVLARSRLFVELLVLVGAGLSKLQFGAAGVFGFFPVAVAGISAVTTVFRLFQIQVSKFFLRLRARVGDGRAQFQLFAFSLREVGVILLALGKVARPIATAIAKFGAGNPSAKITKVVSSLRRAGTVLEKLDATLSRLLALLKGGLPTVNRDLEKAARTGKKLTGGRGGGGGGDPNSGGGIVGFLRGLGKNTSDAKEAGKDASKRTADSARTGILANRTLYNGVRELLFGFLVLSPAFRNTTLSAISVSVSTLFSGITALIGAVAGKGSSTIGGALSSEILPSIAAAFSSTFGSVLLGVLLPVIASPTLFNLIGKEIIPRLAKSVGGGFRDGFLLGVRSFKNARVATRAASTLRQATTPITASFSDLFSKIFPKGGRITELARGSGRALAAGIQTVASVALGVVGAKGTSKKLFDSALKNFSRSGIPAVTRFVARATGAVAATGFADVGSLVKRLGVSGFRLANTAAGGINPNGNSIDAFTGFLKNSAVLRGLRSTAGATPVGREGTDELNKKKAAENAQLRIVQIQVKIGEARARFEESTLQRRKAAEVELRKLQTVLARKLKQESSGRPGDARRARRKLPRIREELSNQQDIVDNLSSDSSPSVQRLLAQLGRQRKIAARLRAMVNSAQTPNTALDQLSTAASSATADSVPERNAEFATALTGAVEAVNAQIESAKAVVKAERSVASARTDQAVAISRGKQVGAAESLARANKLFRLLLAAGTGSVGGSSRAPNANVDPSAVLDELKSGKVRTSEFRTAEDNPDLNSLVGSLQDLVDPATTVNDVIGRLLSDIENSEKAGVLFERIAQSGKVIADNLGKADFKNLFKGFRPEQAQALTRVLVGLKSFGGFSRGGQNPLDRIFASGSLAKLPASVDVGGLKDVIARSISQGLQSGVDDADISASLNAEIKEFSAGAGLSPTKLGLSPASVRKQIALVLGEFRKAGDPESSGVVQLIDRIIKSVGKFAPEVAAQLSKNEGKITDAVRKSIVGPIKFDIGFASLPRGALRAPIASFRLMGATIGVEMLKGVGALRQGVNTFVGRGFAGLFDSASAILTSPILAAVSVIETSFTVAGAAVAGAGGFAAGLAGLIPIIGGPLGRVIHGLSGALGGIVKVAGRAFGAVGKSIANIISAGVNGLKKLKQALREVALEVSDIGFEAEKTGQDTREFAALAGALKPFGIEATEASQALIQIRDRLIEARREATGPAADAFRQLGVDLSSLADPNNVAVLLDVAGALTQIRGDAELVRSTLELPGASFTALRTALQSGPELRERFERELESPLLFTEEQIKLSREVRAEFAQLDVTLSRIRGQLLIAFAPLIELSRERGVVDAIIFRASAIAAASAQVFASQLDVVINKVVPELRSLFSTQEFRTSLIGAGRDFIKFLTNNLSALVSRMFAAIGKKLPGISKFFIRNLPKIIGANALVLVGVVLSTLSGIFIKISAILLDAFGETLNLFGLGGPTGREAVQRLNFAKAKEKSITASINAAVDDVIKGAGLENLDLSELFGGSGEFSVLPESTKKLIREFSTLLKDLGLGVDVVSDFTETYEQLLRRQTGAAEAFREQVAAGASSLTSMERSTLRIAGSVLRAAKSAQQFRQELSSAIGDFNIDSGLGQGREQLVNQVNALLKLPTAFARVQTQLGTALGNVLAETGINDPGGAAQKSIADLTNPIRERLQELVARGFRDGFKDPLIIRAAEELQRELALGLREITQDNPGFGIFEPLFQIDITKLFASTAATVAQVARTIKVAEAATQGVSQFTQGWAISLSDVGTAEQVINAQLELFIRRLQVASVDTINAAARLLGLEQATRKEVELRAAALAKAAIESNKAAVALQQFQRVQGTVDGLIGSVGDLSLAFNTSSIRAAEIPLKVAATTTEIRQVLTQNKALLPVLSEWLGVQGDIESVVAQLEKRFTKILEINNELATQREFVQLFERVDNVLERVGSSRNFSAFADETARAALEAFKLRQELSIANTETEALFEIMAQDAPERLVEVAKRLSEAGRVGFSVALEAGNAEELARQISQATAAALETAIRNIELRPLVEEVRQSVTGPLVEGFSGVLRGLADGSIAEAARTAKAQADEVGDKFSTVLFTLSKLGETLFSRAFDRFLDRFSGRLNDVITESLVSGLADGRVGAQLETLRNQVGAIASGVLAGLGLVLSRLQSTASSVSDSIDSAVEQREQLRGVISGDSSVAIKEVGEQLEDALTPTNRLLTDIRGILQALTGGTALPGSPLATAAISTV